jgi:hypothetical protein
MGSPERPAGIPEVVTASQARLTGIPEVVTGSQARPRGVPGYGKKLVRTASISAFSWPLGASAW